MICFYYLCCVIVAEVVQILAVLLQKVLSCEVHDWRVTEHKGHM